MKNLAKLALYFCLSFAIIFLAATGIRFLVFWIEWVRIMPQVQETVLAFVIASARWALTLALYGSLLLSLGFAARKQCPAPMVIICLVILSLCLTYLVSVGLTQRRLAPLVQPVQNMASPLGGDGLILSHALTRNETAIVLLRGLQEPRGPRVVAIPERPLTFQPEAPAVTDFTLPSIPFQNETPWLLRSLSIDIRLSAQQMYSRFNQGLIPFLIYSGALVFLLSSLGFIFKLSTWPLVSFFLVCLAFRGVLAMEVFFSSPETQGVVGSFIGNIGNMLPAEFVIPAIFCGLGILVNIYSALVSVVKKAKK